MVGGRTVTPLWMVRKKHSSVMHLKDITSGKANKHKPRELVTLLPSFISSCCIFNDYLPQPEQPQRPYTAIGVDGSGIIMPGLHPDLGSQRQVRAQITIKDLIDKINELATVANELVSEIDNLRGYVISLRNEINVLRKDGERNNG